MSVTARAELPTLTETISGDVFPHDIMFEISGITDKISRIACTSHLRVWDFILGDSRPNWRVEAIIPFSFDTNCCQQTENWNFRGKIPFDFIFLNLEIATPIDGVSISNCIIIRAGTFIVADWWVGNIPHMSTNFFCVSTHSLNWKIKRRKCGWKRCGGIEVRTIRG